MFLSQPGSNLHVPAHCCSAINEQADRLGLTPFLDQLRGISTPKQRTLGLQSRRKAIPENAASLTAQPRQPYQPAQSPAFGRPVSPPAMQPVIPRQNVAANAVAPAAAASSTGAGMAKGVAADVREASAVVKQTVAADAAARGMPPLSAAVQTVPPAVTAEAPASAPAPAAPPPAATAAAAPAAVAAAAAATTLLEPLPQAGPVQPRAANVSGLWAKDAARTDTAAFERCLDVMHLSGLQKVTARLIEGLDIKQVRIETHTFCSKHRPSLCMRQSLLLLMLY